MTPLGKTMLEVEAIGARILANDQQLLRSGGDQLFCLAKNRVGAAAHQVAAQVRNDAEGAAVIAAFGNLQIAVVARRKLQPAFRNKVGEG